MNLEELREHTIFQQQSKEIWRNNDASTIVDLLLEEALELKEAIIKAEIGAGATEVASEISDVQILLFQLANLCGIDIAQAGYAKLVRNDLKAPNTAINNGYPEPYKTTSEAYKMMGGDEMFYQVYLLLLADE